MYEIYLSSSSPVCCRYNTVLKAFGTPFGPHDTKTAFCDTSKVIANSGVRRLVMCPSFPLADLKSVKTMYGCTVNDVVCACLSGAIHRYQKHFDDPTANKTPWIRAAIPYAFADRPKDRLTNSWTFVSLSFACRVSLFCLF